jgi:hypothetical protein
VANHGSHGDELPAVVWLCVHRSSGTGTREEGRVWFGGKLVACGEDRFEGLMRTPGGFKKVLRVSREFGRRLTNDEYPYFTLELDEVCLHACICVMCQY